MAYDREQEQDHELNARLQFIRVLQSVTAHYGVQWMITHGFVRRLLNSQDMIGSDLNVVITPIAPVLLTQFYAHIHKIVDEIEVLGYANHIKKRSLSHCSLKSAILVDMTKEVTFDVHIEFSYVPYIMPAKFSCDQIHYTNAGFKITPLTSSATPEFDRINQTPGISLLDRMIQMKNRVVHALVPYNRRTDEHARLDNSRHMLREKKLLDEGYTIYGETLFLQEPIDGESCPICMAAVDMMAVIDCQHRFCVECLAKHMSMKGASHETCPMCRAPIVLVTQSV